MQIDSDQLVYWKISQSQTVQLYENDYFDAREYEHTYNQIYGNEEDNEDWRNDEIDHAKCENILKNYKECLKNGTFLIRKSENKDNFLTLCFL